MPILTDHTSGNSIKMLFMGDSGTGKTGALASLVAAGYKLRIFDFDNGLDSLVAHARRECADRLPNVEYETIQDRYKGTQMGAVLDGSARGFTEAMLKLDKWSDDTKPSEWDSTHIVVIDSLTRLSDYAFNRQTQLNPGAKDKRQIFFAAQNDIEAVLALLTAATFKPNVIVISHVKMQERPDGTMKGYPTAVGSALGPTIPSYFNSVALAQTSGIGTSVQRTIQTAPTALIDLKNPASFSMLPTLPLKTGLADFFKTLKG